MSPKAFISYSWSSQEHQELIRTWAERLLADGVEVVMDIYDLNEGDDVNAYIERMVTDETVTQVLIFSDQEYKRKADSRERGVGKESIIISQEVYSKVEQSKFIPIVTEFDADGNAFLPVFLASRKWIDFSSPSAVNSNWEQLIRVLFGKPFYSKPKVGNEPSYIDNEESESLYEIRAKFETLKQDLIDEKSNIQLARNDFVDVCFDYANNLQELEIKSGDDIPTKLLGIANQLVPVRNYLIDWVMLDSSKVIDKEFDDFLVEFLERIQALKFHRPDMTRWNPAIFEAFSLFIYELFLYIVAALIKNARYQLLNKLFSYNYLRPKVERSGDRKFTSFQTFYERADSLNKALIEEGKKLHSPAAEFIHQNADRKDINFEDILQADLLILLFSALHSEINWYPQTFYYLRSSEHDFPFFIKATRHMDFLNLAQIIGENDVDKIRETVSEQLQRERFHKFYFISFYELMNLKNLDTIQ